MADWKVIALVSGNIEAVSGPAAQNRPRTHEWIVWEGQAANKAEALKCAEKACPIAPAKTTFYRANGHPERAEKIPCSFFLSISCYPKVATI